MHVLLTHSNGQQTATHLLVLLCLRRAVACPRGCDIVGVRIIRIVRRVVFVALGFGACFAWRHHDGGTAYQRHVCANDVNWRTLNWQLAIGTQRDAGCRSVLGCVVVPSTGTSVGVTPPSFVWHDLQTRSGLD